MYLLEAVVCLLATLCHVGAFNLDTEHFTRHGAPGQRPAMFGFAVASHMERGQPWVMVGAPEAQTYQPGVEKGGAVYRCEPTRDDACAEVPFDRTGNNNDSTGDQIDKKSYQWFGATLSSAGEDGPFVACAPRYVSYSTKKNRRDPVGTCFVTRNGFSETLEFAPCRTRNWGYHKQGSCQAGLGASVSKDGRRVFIGAPGSWYWQGQMYSVNPSIRLPFTPPRYKEYGEGQLYSQSVDNRPTVLSTAESPATDDDSYLGYSVIVGDFSGSGEQGVAVGMPRGEELLGKVVLYSWDLQNIHNVTGEQIGGYFGYSLCSSDVDGDGLDDLIVGAPMYTPINNEGKYDVGRIYIIYQNSDEGRYQKFHIRDGTTSKGRFGLALASLGDINLDGFGDFAVGAPYDGLAGRGAVYIYHGGVNGVREKASQVIKAEDTAYSTLTTFGFSLAGGVDLDSNQYNDLVVGAYEADTAFLFRAKPVVKMTASILFGTDSKLISLDDKNCTLTNRRKVTCTTINYCLTYDGIGVDTLVDFDLQFVLDTKKPNDPRLYFLDHEGRNMLNQTIPLVRDKMYCNSLPVYIMPNIRDKLMPIEAEIRYSMREDPSVTGVAAAGRRRNPRSVLRPILDQNVPNVQKDSINIQKNCGSDNVCIPDLRMIATPNVDKYLLGSKERLVIDVIVQNLGEDAFEATYDLKVPGGVNYIKIERIDNAVSEIPVQCSPPTSFNNYTLKCDIGNPLPQGRLVHFKVLLEPFHKTGMAPTYEFFMEANSTNPELSHSVADNQKSMSIGIWLETDLIVTGTSYPPDLHYNTSLYKEGNFSHETDIGPQLVHLYGIRNNGPSTIEEAEVFLLWPYETLAGDSLMYVLEQPQTSGNIRCDFAEHVNDLNLIIDPKRKSYLDSSSAALQGGTVGGGGVNVVSSGGASAAGGSSSGASWSSSSGSGSSGGASWSSSRNASWSSSSSGGRVLTEEQKRRMDEEEKKFNVETGDGSQVHVQRAQQAHSGGGGGQWAAGGGGGRYINASSSSYNHTSSGGAAGGRQQGSWGAGRQIANQGASNGRTTWTVQGGQGAQGGTVGWDQQSGQTGWSSGSQGSGESGARGGQSGGIVHTTTWNRTYNSDRGQRWPAERWESTQGRRIDGGVVEAHGSGAQGTIVHTSGSQEGRVRQGGVQYGEVSHVGQGSGAQGTIVHTGGSQEGRVRQGGVQYGEVSHVGQGSGAQGTIVHTGGSQEGRVRQGGVQYGEVPHGGVGQGSGGNNQEQWSWYERKPVGGVHNKTYTTTWNTTWDGSGPPVVHKSSWNTSSHLGADGKVRKTETSTEFYQVGAEGEIGSSFNNRLDEANNYDRSYQTHTTYVHGGARGYEDASSARADGGSRTSSSSVESAGGIRVAGGSGGNRIYTLEEENQGQGGSTRYGAGSYTSGGARTYHTGDGRYLVPATNQNWGEGDGNYVSTSGRNKWSTEETVNKDLINAGSATFHYEGGSSGVHSGASNTRVGQPQKPVGLAGAAAGQGYRVGTWDLGTLDTQKTGQQSGSGGSGAQSYSSSYQTQWSSSDNRDNVATDRPQQHFRWDRHTRDKRQADLEDAAERQRHIMMEKNEQQLAEATQCPGLRCARVRCIAGPMKTNHEIWVAIRSRVNAQTLKKLTFDGSITLTSVAVARVSKLPYLGEPLERPPHAQQASSVLTPLPMPQPAEPVPLWVVVLSACAGAALLLLLIFALYKCGFFKRNRPSDAPERQPLNRNGYGHEDEQL